MTPTETRYAQTEKEALALTWVCERSWEYIVGNSIYVETDHQPLVPLLTTHTLDQRPPFIQRIRMRMMRFHFKQVTHVPGKKMYIADALSGLQTPGQAVTTVDDEEMKAHVASVISSLPASDGRLQQIMEAQEEDPVCRQIKTYCYEGWPDKHLLKDAIKPYWHYKGELSVAQNMLLKGSRIVIPSSMRLEILNKIHVGHQGFSIYRKRAKSSLWWPGISRETQDLVQQCRKCALQSNGEVERGVRTVKNILTQEKDPAKWLLAHRSTPSAWQYSPAQLLMGRQIRNSLPTFHTQLDPQWPDLQSLRARETMSKLKQQSTFNSRHRAMPLTPIEPGTEVHIKDLQHLGIVEKVGETPHSYEVQTPTITVRRNRAHAPDTLTRAETAATYTREDQDFNTCQN